MPLYAGELNIRRGAPLAEYPAPLSEVLSAQAEDTRIHNPTNALIRLRDLNAANRDAMTDPGDPLSGRMPTYEPVIRMDAETARARVKEEGLSLNVPDEGISSKALDILIKAKREELQRQNVFSRGPDGIGAGAARLGTALLNSVYDPLNIASAFVPVIGPARYLSLLERAGSGMARAGVRMGIGAAEGAVGAAILEPLIYGAAQAEQLDYTMADSLANVAFGGVFGGGLHVTAGGVRDLVQPNWWRDGTGAEINVIRRDPDTGRGPDAAEVAVRGASPETRETMLRASVAQAAEGRLTSVDGILRAEREAIGGAYDRVRGNPAGAADDPTVRLRPMDIGEVLLERGPGTVGEKDGEITVRPGGYGLLKIIWKHGEKSTKDPAFRVTRDDVLNTADVIRDYKPVIDETQPDGKRLLEWHVRRNDGKSVIYAVRGFAENKEQHVVNVLVNEGKTQKALEMPLSELRSVEPESPAGSSQGFRRDTGSTVFSSLPNGQVNGTVARGAALAQARAEAQKNAAPGAVRSADPEASAAADQTAKAAAKGGSETLAAAEAQLEQALDMADSFAEVSGNREVMAMALGPYAKAIVRAEEYGKALKAAAACGLA